MAVMSGALDIDTSAETAFGLICSVEKWPVWLSFLRSAHRVDAKAPVALGSEVVVRSLIPGGNEQMYEVDTCITNYHLSLVGAYSVRRRIDFRVEQKTSRSKVHLRVEYPSYYGWLGSLYDRVTAGRKLSALLQDSLVQFKSLVEYQRGPGTALADL